MLRVSARDVGSAWIPAFGAGGTSDGSGIGLVLAGVVSCQAADPWKGISASDPPTHDVACVGKLRAGGSHVAAFCGSDAHSDPGSARSALSWSHAASGLMTAALGISGDVSLGGSLEGAAFFGSSALG